MKIEKQVETFVDVTVDVSLEDIVCAIAEDTQAAFTVMRGINNCWVFLKAIPDSIVAEMNDKQKKTIFDALTVQVQRFAPTVSREQTS